MKTPKLITLENFEQEYAKQQNSGSIYHNELNNLSPGSSLSERVSQLLGQEDFKNGLIIKPADKWLEEAALKPVSRQLFGELWFQDEVCILFGDTGTGKSILAYQITESLARGIPMTFAEHQVGTQPVLYIDCELSDKQVLMRYSDKGKNRYYLHHNFCRAEISSDSTPPIGTEYDEYIVRCIENGLKETGAKILVVDNISYLKTETEKAKDALGLMKYLKLLKNTYGLSILVLAHTPKRDQSREIEVNHLAGSKALANFCDSAIAIGQSSRDKSLRYIKQIKARNTEVLYGSQNVILCSIIKDQFNFLQFKYVQHTTEQEHLKEVTAKDREEIISEVKELSKKGFTQREIADKLHISNGVVHKYLKME